MLIVLGWALSLRLFFAALAGNTYDPDEFVILSLSRDLSHGEIPYRDFMFFHPPGVLVLFRWLQPLIAWWWPSARLVMLLVDSLTAVFVWRIGVLLYGRQSGLAAGFLYGVSPLALVCAGRVGQDPLITALGTGGLLLLLSRPSRRAAVLAGACLGVAIWIKYPAVLFFPVFALAAPKRAWITASAAAMVSALAFAPLVHELPAFYSQTLLWQLHREPADLSQRLGGLVAYWLLLNPLTVFALLRRRRYSYPSWLLAGFGLGVLFFFGSRVYYHYFMPILPFAVLIATPLLADVMRRSPVKVVTAAIAFAVLWAADMSVGIAPAQLYIATFRLTALQPTVRLLDRLTGPGQAVLTDRFEYVYFARRMPVANYFWNMDTSVGARYLERQLGKGSAVVVTRHVTTGYPIGLLDYLRDKRYPEIRTKVANVWIVSGTIASQSTPAIHGGRARTATELDELDPGEATTGRG